MDMMLDGIENMSGTLMTMSIGSIIYALMLPAIGIAILIVLIKIYSTLNKK